MNKRRKKGDREAVKSIHHNNYNNINKIWEWENRRRKIIWRKKKEYEPTANEKRIIWMKRTKWKPKRWNERKVLQFWSFNVALWIHTKRLDSRFPFFTVAFRLCFLFDHFDLLSSLALSLIFMSFDVFILFLLALKLHILCTSFLSSKIKRNENCNAVTYADILLLSEQKQKSRQKGHDKNTFCQFVLSFD